MNTIYYRINNYITSIYHKFIQSKIICKNKPIQLGRWNINDTHKTNIKIDYANEDHCGTCLMTNTSKLTK
jgi:hypothetical protein